MSSHNRAIETVARRIAAVLVASETLFLMSSALLAQELAGGVLPEPGPPTPASERLAGAAPYLLLLPWFAVGAVALWNGLSLSNPWRLAEWTVLCVVALANLYAAYLLATGYLPTAEAIIFIPACLTVACVCALVATGRLRGQPLAD